MKDINSENAFNNNIFLFSSITFSIFPQLETEYEYKSLYLSNIFSTALIDFLFIVFNN